jgi:hypothetical protein
MYKGCTQPPSELEVLGTGIVRRRTQLWPWRQPTAGGVSLG